MLTYVARRILVSLPVVFGVSVVTFLFANLAPGDPVSSLVSPGSGVRPGDIENLRKALGLDSPIYLRYLTWISQMLQGNLGVSFVNHRPVAQTILDRIPNSLSLMLTAFVISVVVGVALGVVVAFRQNSFIDHAMTLVVMTGISVPSFLLALVAIYLFAAQFPVLPSSGMSDPTSSDPPLVDVARHLVLPVSVLSLGGVATFLRYTRASVLEVVRQDYVTTARSKGLGERTIRMRHVLRNALLPIVTVAGLTLPGLVGGAFFVEVVFSWPGLGSLTVQATLSHDYPVIMAMALVLAVAIILSNLAADIVYAVVDPRIRLQQ